MMKNNPTRGIFIELSVPTSLARGGGGGEGEGGGIILLW